MVNRIDLLIYFVLRLTHLNSKNLQLLWLSPLSHTEVFEPNIIV